MKIAWVALLGLLLSAGARAARADTLNKSLHLRQINSASRKTPKYTGVVFERGRVRRKGRCLPHALSEANPAFFQS